MASCGSWTTRASQSRSYEESPRLEKKTTTSTRGIRRLPPRAIIGGVVAATATMEKASKKLTVISFKWMRMGIPSKSCERRGTRAAVWVLLCMDLLLPLLFQSPTIDQLWETRKCHFEKSSTNPSTTKLLLAPPVDPNHPLAAPY